MTNIKILWRSKWLNLSLFLTTFILVSYFSAFGFVLKLLGENFSYSPMVFAQTMTPEKVAEEVYQRIPDLPLQNNYIRRETNQIAIENTFVSRLVRYHQYSKSRPTIFRLDWKLTLADYLGKNEIINDDRYPGNNTLTRNPLEGDRQIIETLTVKQRNNLVNVLVSIYNPNAENKPKEKPQQTQQNNNSSSPILVLPTPGGADLLSP
ncbi:hypothetical protein [Geminocystis sp. GBBB08]|uniref:hypothetical protein n=1 Tax=Geminocystis sp. GBBB08 TaxID=2604140 RepID=UPI0027E25642|nr:hypothetical protein [Geminocystis sp. GBBB08]MBL1208843.1 hypothetical protein [Geminocystis sp. GBBB08]